MSENTDTPGLLPPFDLSAKPTREIVALAHLLILGTPPRTEHQMAKGLECGTVSLLRQSLLNSRRFDTHVMRGTKGPFMFFIHIPKTAGGSLRGYFKTALGDACRWYMKNPKKGTSPLMRRDVSFNVEDHLSKYRMSGGHIPFLEIPETLVEREPVFVSVIRNPVDRALSYYNFLRTQENHAGHERMRDLTLFEALQTGHFYKQCDRFQLDFLTGENDAEATLKVMGEHKFLVGKQEYLNAFMRSLHQLLGLPLVPSESKQIHRSTSDYITKMAAQPRYDEAIEIITKLNEEEFKFYNSFGDIWTNIRARKKNS